MVAAALGAVLLAAACGSNPGEPWVPVLQIRVEGRMERSLTARATLLRNGTAVPAGEVAWSVEPASAGEITASGELRFREAGSLTVRARLGDRETAETLEVAVPPRIAFDMRPEEGAARDVYAVDLDGRNPARLTDDPATDVHPTAAGQTVVFVSYRDGNGELYRMSAAGTDHQRLTDTPGPEEQPALSGDGARLAFLRRGSGVSKVWAAEADGTGAGRVTEGSDFADGIEAAPSWAPGADSLAFMSTARGDADLYRWSPAGVTPVVEGDGAELEPEWGPDGGRLLFTADRTGGNADLYLLDLTTGEETALTSAPENEGNPSWVGGDRVVYTFFTEDGSELRWLEIGGDGARTIPVPGVEPEHPVELR